MTQAKITITSLGTIAQQILAQAHKASVWGITKRGVFLYIPSGWVIFLSSEPFRGPLILNSSDDTIPLQSLRPGVLVDVCDGNLHFNIPDITVCADRAALWSVPHRVDVSPAILAMRFKRLETIYQQVLTARGESSLVDIFSCLMSATGRGRTSNGGNLSDNLQDLLLFKQVRNPQESTSMVSTLERFLGLGPGLTPSGDDLVLGFLLAVNRWGNLLYPKQDVQSINRAIRQAAYRKTTILSANLLSCVTKGQVDERLVIAMDGIMTGKPDPGTCVSHLLNWGNSSGVSAMMGMALAFMID